MLRNHYLTPCSGVKARCVFLSFFLSGRKGKLKKKKKHAVSPVMHRKKPCPCPPTSPTKKKKTRCRKSGRDEGFHGSHKDAAYMVQHSSEQSRTEYYIRGGPGLRFAKKMTMLTKMIDIILSWEKEKEKYRIDEERTEPNEVGF